MLEFSKTGDWSIGRSLVYVDKRNYNEIANIMDHAKTVRPYSLVISTTAQTKNSIGPPSSCNPPLASIN